MLSESALIGALAREGVWSSRFRLRETILWLTCRSLLHPALFGFPRLSAFAPSSASTNPGGHTLPSYTARSTPIPALEPTRYLDTDVSICADRVSRVHKPDHLLAHLAGCSDGERRPPLLPIFRLQARNSIFFLGSETIRPNAAHTHSHDHRRHPLTPLTVTPIQRPRCRRSAFSPAPGPGPLLLLPPLSAGLSGPCLLPLFLPLLTSLELHHAVHVAPLLHTFLLSRARYVTIGSSPFVV